MSFKDFMEKIRAVVSGEPPVDDPSADAPPVDDPPVDARQAKSDAAEIAMLEAAVFNGRQLPDGPLSPDPKAGNLLRRFFDLAWSEMQTHGSGGPHLYNGGLSPILESPPPTRARVIEAALRTHLVRLKGVRVPQDWRGERPLLWLAEELLRKRPTLDPEALADLGEAAIELPDDRFDRGAPNPLVSALVWGLDVEPPDRLVAAARSLSNRLLMRDYAEQRRRGARLAGAIEPGPDDGLPLATEPWASTVRDDVAASGQTEGWATLLEHASKAGGKSKPSARWAKQAAAMVEALGVDHVRDRFGAWLEVAPVGPKMGLTHWVDAVGMMEANHDILKGLIWASASFADPTVAAAVGRHALRCYRKIPDHGPASPALGNGCAYALADMPEGLGVAHLSRLVGKVRYGSARKVLDKALDRAAEAAGVGRDELEEMALPTFELDLDGVRRAELAGFTAELAVEGKTAVLRWVTPAGKAQKSVPKAVKEAHGPELKALKADLKELKELLEGQAGRLERLLLSDPTWAAELWRERYLEHPLVRPLVTRLVWQVGDTLVLWRDGCLRDGDGEAAALQGDVRLWHPIDSDASTTQAWRQVLLAGEITQPFSQAFREIYLVTPAEEETDTYSNRFAAHILRQHQFLALCQQRGWAYRLQGNFDSHNTPSKTVGDWTVEFWVDGVQDDGATFAHVATDQVRFSQGPGPSRIVDVPSRLFSELMREVDLFVAVCSVGNDPEWQDGGPDGRFRDYWQGYAWGELNVSAKARAEVLRALVPKLAIAGQLEVQDRFLVVQGKRKRYRIHLGSTNIQMEPGGYLCIVPGRGRETARGRVYLPFEGDRTLSIILSKAFMLAKDDKIKDPTILRQMER